MNQVLYGYSVSGATWLYLSALLIVGVYFRFSRLWSTRNLDLVLLLALSPGLLLVRQADVAADPDRVRTIGYAILLATSLAILLRVLVDPFAKWRPRFEQNMNSAGMLWLSVCAVIFLGTRAIAEPIVAQAAAPLVVEAAAGEGTSGPASPLAAAPMALLIEQLTPPVFAICAHLAVIVGLLVIGRRLLDDFGSGVAMVAMYLLLPCTSLTVGEVNHVLPSAFLLWAFVNWRRPLAAGILVALACGMLVFPVFLLPLWLSFLGRSGWKRFLMGFAATAAVLFGSFALISTDLQQFVERTTGAMEWYRLTLQSPVLDAADAAPVAVAERSGDFWTAANYWEPYRLPVIAAFAIMLIVMTVWPRPKTLELLLAQQVATIIAVQFWLPDAAGTYILWYLPILLTLMFRTRLTMTFEQAERFAAARQTTKPASSTSIPATSSLR